MGGLVRVAFALDKACVESRSSMPYVIVRGEASHDWQKVLVKLSTKKASGLSEDAKIVPCLENDARLCPNRAREVCLGLAQSRRCESWRWSGYSHSKPWKSIPYSPWDNKPRVAQRWMSEAQSFWREADYSPCIAAQHDMPDTANTIELSSISLLQLWPPVHHSTSLIVQISLQIVTMGVDAGFDMVPPLSKGAVDKCNWDQFIEFIKNHYKSDTQVEIKPNYILFKAGEHPKLPFEGHKLLRFSSKVSGSTAITTRVESYLDTVTQIAKLHFGSRVRCWDECHDQRGHYGWHEIHESIRSYQQVSSPAKHLLLNNV